jgi:zinc transport system substrate-binding protein
MKRYDIVSLKANANDLHLKMKGELIMKQFKTYSILIFAVLIGLMMTGCSSEEEENKASVAVSIVPQRDFVNAVAKDLVDVTVMIPPGFSETNYQPTPKELQALSDADIYFAIGVPAEEANILPRLTEFNKEVTVVNLWSEVAEVYPAREFDSDHGHGHEDEDDHGHSHEGIDPHIWLSPKRVVVMIQVIVEELSLVYPEHADAFKKNGDEYIVELEKLDLQIKDALAEYEDEPFIIYHPAFGYFADDYHLEMIAIEEDGKEASAKRIQEVIDLAKENDIKFVFYQEEFDSSQAETIAKEIGGATVKVAPLSEQYIENLQSIVEAFTEVLVSKE